MEKKTYIKPQLKIATTDEELMETASVPPGTPDLGEGGEGGGDDQAAKPFGNDITIKGVWDR